MKSKITSQDFTIVAFSFGVLMALEVVHMLELNGYKGRAILIDGSPDVIKILMKQFTKLPKQGHYHALTLLYISYFSPTSDMPKIKVRLFCRIVHGTLANVSDRIFCVVLHNQLLVNIELNQANRTVFKVFLNI